MELNGLKYLVVGAGFSGAVTARLIAEDLGERVLVIDRRNHVGGNCHSAFDAATGIECHLYGSHIFHTCNERVWRFIGKYAQFNGYRHKVLTAYRGRVYQMPINLATINAFYGAAFSPREARLFLEEEIEREGIVAPKNLEEKALSMVGRPLYEAFVKGYTVKQWDLDPVHLPEDIITRLPVRYDYKSDYFNDPWQGVPLEGYASLFEDLLDHDGIDVATGVDFFAIKDALPPGCRVIFTGPIDRFFEYKHGALGWRTQRFEKEVVPVRDFQGTAVMNYAEACVAFTRIHEFRHYHDERRHPEDRTVIYREYSTGENAWEEPYYPVNTARDRELFVRYREEAQTLENVHFCGRLGTYRYLNMDQAIDEAISLYETRIKPQAERGQQCLDAAPPVPVFRKAG